MKPGNSKAMVLYILTADDPRASSTITSKSIYRVEGNMLKIARIGRSGKYLTYQVIEREGDKMTLKGGMEGYHYFRKK